LLGFLFKTWMPGTRPGMTSQRARLEHHKSLIMMSLPA
jgi:hypothetical protein